MSRGLKMITTKARKPEPIKIPSQSPRHDKRYGHQILLALPEFSFSSTLPEKPGARENWARDVIEKSYRIVDEYRAGGSIWKPQDAAVAARGFSDYCRKISGQEEDRKVSKLCRESDAVQKFGYTLRDMFPSIHGNVDFR